MLRRSARSVVFSLLACAFLGLDLISSIRAATYYTATNGRDTNNGAIGTPFRTLAKGVSKLLPGDILYVRSGAYAEALIANVPGGSSWDRPVTVAAYPGESVTLRPGIGASRVLYFRGPAVAGLNQQYIVIDGFILDARNVAFDAIKLEADYFNPSTGEIRGVPHHIRISRCEVRNAPGNGILVAPGPYYNQFIGLSVHSNGITDHDHGFYVISSNNVISGCNIYDNAGWGVQIYSGYAGVRVNNNIVSNSFIHDNAEAIVLAPGMTYVRGPGIGIYCGDGNLVYNNVVWSNNIGIELNYNATHTRIYNNTFYANMKNGVTWRANMEITAGSSNTSVINNIVWGPAGPINDAGVATVKSNNLTNRDPLFVDVSKVDFGLRAGSPAINAGILLPEVTTDITGYPRQSGGSTACDIGAYEYAAGSTSGG